MRLFIRSLLLLAVPALAGAESIGSALDLWQRSLVAQRFDDLRTIGTLTTRFPNGDEVVLRVELLAVMQRDRINRMGLTRVISGNALLNSTFLNIERPSAPDDLWIFLPGLGTPRRLVSTNLADSYLGSEFRYADLVQRDPNDYVAHMRGVGMLDAEPCDIIEIIPKESRLARDSGLSREVLWLRQRSFVERRVEQYDRRGALLKVIELPRLFLDSASGKAFPVERRVENVQSGTVSIALFETVRVNQGLSHDLFSPAHLADRSW